MKVAGKMEKMTFMANIGRKHFIEKIAIFFV